ncbi:MAG: D-aminoacyl-tRNA deacylase [Clostridia bacterium]|jgi:D-tyrosyl-tRNA(Tyr) deacylase
MIAVIQRVLKSSIAIDHTVISEISNGLNILLCVVNGDTEKDMKYIADKMVRTRIFSDDEGKMNLSVMDVKGELMVISQFTLAADSRKGNRPSFINAALPDKANEMYSSLIEYIRQNYDVPVRTGIFAANMQVSILNNGPVTIILNSKDKLNTDEKGKK